MTDVEHYYLIDMENVHLPGLIGLNMLGEDSEVCLFISNNMHTGSSKLKKCIKSSKARFNSIFCNITAKNAVDFQIAAYCGFVLNNPATKRINLVSRDEGFNSLEDYVKQARNDVVFYQACTVFEAYAAAELGVSPERYERGEKQDIRDIMEETREKRDPLYKSLTGICSGDEIRFARQLMEDLEGSTMRDKYLRMIKCFGKEKGTVIYNAAKDVLAHDHM